MEVDPAINELAYRVTGAAIEVQKELGGPGLLEDVYETALCREFDLRGIRYRRQHPVLVFYKGQSLQKTYIVDLIVEDVLIIELKATEIDHAVFRAQCRTQLVLCNLYLGLVINFGQTSIKQGTHRVIDNEYLPPAAKSEPGR